LDGTHGTLAGSTFQILQHAGQREVPDAALPGTGCLHLARTGLDGRDQFGDRLVRRIRRDLDTGGIGVHQADRRIGSAGKVSESLPMHHADLDGDEADGVAVRRRRGNCAVADYATAAGPIDDGDRLAKLFLEQRADDACGRVGTASGGPGHDQLDRAVGISSKCRAGDGERAERDERALEQVHGILLECDGASAAAPDLSSYDNRCERTASWATLAARPALVKWSDQLT
jgi:hypothetical protein